jgi:hypothetical protein
MFIDPLTVLDGTLENLELLCAFLSDEIDERMHDPDTLTPQARKYKEALLTIKILMPKLREVRAAQMGQIARNQLPLCIHCE